MDGAVRGQALHATVLLSLQGQPYLEISGSERKKVILKGSLLCTGRRHDWTGDMFTEKFTVVSHLPMGSFKSNETLAWISD